MLLQPLHPSISEHHLICRLTTFLIFCARISFKQAWIMTSWSFVSRFFFFRESVLWKFICPSPREWCHIKVPPDFLTPLPPPPVFYPSTTGFMTCAVWVMSGSWFFAACVELEFLYAPLPATTAHIFQMADSLIGLDFMCCAVFVCPRLGCFCASFFFCFSPVASGLWVKRNEDVTWQAY